VVSCRPGIGGFQGTNKRREPPSLSSVGAAQDGEARQGPRQGELPASLTASLKRSL
jgi:hypothetical protein